MVENTFCYERGEGSRDWSDRKNRRTPLHTKLPEQISERNLPEFPPTWNSGQGNPGSREHWPWQGWTPHIDSPVNMQDKGPGCVPPLPTHIAPTPHPLPLSVTFYRKFRNFLSPPLSAKPFQPPDPWFSACSALLKQPFQSSPENGDCGLIWG